MASYTLLSKNDIQDIADNYNLKVIKSVPIEGGNGNSSYKLTTETNKYVLTVCDDKTLDEVTVEHPYGRSYFPQIMGLNIDAPEADKANKHWQMVELAEAVNEIPSEDFMNAIFK